MFFFKESLMYWVDSLSPSYWWRFECSIIAPATVTIDFNCTYFIRKSLLIAASSECAKVAF